MASRPQARPGAAHRRLRPVSELPSRAKLFVLVVGLAIAGVLVYVSIELVDTDGRPLAILLIVLSCIGGVVVGLGILTATRMAYSLSALPYLLGRVVGRLLGRR